MQDRFRFRVWKKYNCPSYDEHKHEMFYDAEKTYDFLLNKIPENCFSDILEDEKEYIVMQCTGLKDKNGKLIYEGDIIKIEYYDYGIKYRIGVVEWEDDGFRITYHNAKDTKVSGCSLVDIVNGDKQEVIGNIFQDKELMNET